MKRVHAIVVILVALTLMIPSFSSLVSAQTVWRDGEQFKVVNTTKYIIFNISNVIIDLPQDARDINIALYSNFGILNASTTIKTKAFLCGSNGNSTLFIISPKDSNKSILRSNVDLGKLNEWKVVLCEGDKCPNILEAGFVLINSIPAERRIYINSAYAVLSDDSYQMTILTPTNNSAQLIVSFSENGNRVTRNFTISSNKVIHVSGTNDNAQNVRLGTGITWILLMILIPTVAFLFSGGGRRERGRVAGWSLVGILLVILVIIFVIVISRIGFFAILAYIAFIVAFSIILLFLLILILLISFSFLRPAWNNINTRVRRISQWILGDLLNPILDILTSFTQNVVDRWNNLNRNIRTSLISAFVTPLIILNVYLLLQNQVRPSDLFLLLWLFFIIFGVGPTFVLIGGGENGAFFTFGYLLFLIILLEISIPYPIYGLALIALSGYAVVFVQSSIKADIKRKLLSGQKETLETFYNLILGAFILPSTVVLGYAFVGGSGISNVRLEMARDMFKHLFFLYLGMTLTSVLLLWADDLTMSQDRRRLILQNAIAMLLIMLGIGSVSILELNHHPWWAVEVFSGEAVFGIILLVLFSRRN